MKGMEGLELVYLQTLTVLTNVSDRLVQNSQELDWFLQVVPSECFAVWLRQASWLLACSWFIDQIKHYDHYLCAPNFSILMKWLWPTALLP